MSVGLIDYGAGNFASVRNALEHLEIPFVEIREPEALEMTTHLILPGVGAFATAMQRLSALGLVRGLVEHVVERRKPFLGICVGMQVLATEGREFGTHPGLGLIAGVVDKIALPEHSGLRLPHIGWNDVVAARECVLMEGLGDSPIFYFTHSYEFWPDDPGVVVATCDYGKPVTSVIQKGNIFGVQFHPEKSQHHGLQLLRNFALVRSGGEGLDSAC